MAVKELKINIPAPNIQMINVEIVGVTPLVFHKWSEKAIRMIEDKQQKKAKVGREVRNPEEEYQASYYRNKKKEIAFPALSVKQSLVGACRFIDGLQMTIVRGSVFVMGDEEGLIKVDYKSEEMMTSMVTIGMGTADVRYRGQVNGWSMKLPIKYNANILSAEQVVSLVQTAGFSQGLGEWRAERSGEMGSFEVVTE